MNENSNLYESGKCEFSKEDYLYYFLSYDTPDKKYIVYSNNDKIICDIDSGIIPNIPFDNSESISQIASTNNKNNQIETSYIELSTELFYKTTLYSFQSTIIVPYNISFNIYTTISSLVKVPSSSFSNLYSTNIPYSSSTSSTYIQNTIFSTLYSGLLIINSTIIDSYSIKSTEIN